MNFKKLVFVLFVLSTFLFCSLAFADGECVRAGMNSACGYDCKTAGANARCAQTPAGACITVGAKIMCWDPPYQTNRKAQCISAGMNTACGYDCKSAGANVKCSPNPQGRCIVNGAHITCSN